MFEQIKSEVGYTPTRIEYTNGKIKCGVILDAIGQEISTADNWKFISFNDLVLYEKTENQKLIENILSKDISSIDIALR